MTRQGKISFTRRTFLRRAGSAAVVSALPLPFFVGGERLAASLPSIGPVMSELSVFMSKAKEEPLPPEVMEQTKLHVLDTFAAMISGVNLPPAKLALKFAGAHAGEKIATVVGTNMLCSSMEAATVNGVLAHSDETDDSHAPSHSHPGCAVIPAALAAGEQYSISGEHFLRAVALGYDIGPRVLMTLGGVNFQSQTHHDAHSMANTFGASAAAGCAAGLSAQQMRWLLDLASQQAAGIAAWQRDTEHVEKALVFGGMPARNGVMAAEFIHLGATGVDDVFSGSDNFLMAFAPEADARQLIDGLGKRYEVVRTNIKKWTVGSPIQAPLDALNLLMKQHAFHHEEVQRVIVRMATSGARTVDNRDMPDISLQQMIAVMLIDGTVSFQAAHDITRMKDPIMIRERAKVQLQGDEVLEKLYPELVATVEVILQSGESFTQRVDAVRGTVANPMTREEVVAKFHDLTSPVLGSERSVVLAQSVLHLEDKQDLRSLRSALQKSGPQGS